MVESDFGSDFLDEATGLPARLWFNSMGNLATPGSLFENGVVVFLVQEIRVASLQHYVSFGDSELSGVFI